MIDNEVSKKLTACMVGFSGKERKLGEAALSGITSNMKNIANPRSTDSMDWDGSCDR